MQRCTLCRRRTAARAAGAARDRRLTSLIELYLPTAKLDEGLAQFAGRGLDEARPYLIVDARQEREREAGVIRSRAVLLAIGIGGEGRRLDDRVDENPESGGGNVRWVEFARHNLLIPTTHKAQQSAATFATIGLATALNGSPDRRAGPVP